MYSRAVAHTRGENVFLENECVNTINIHVEQAIYRKIDTISVPVISDDADDTNAHVRCIVIGFKHIQAFTIETFEENWKEMSGIRSVYLEASSSLGLSEINLFKRVSSTRMKQGDPPYRDMSTFSHIVSITFNSACGKEEMYLLDLLHRLRLRMLGFTSVYSLIPIVNL